MCLSSGLYCQFCCMRLTHYCNIMAALPASQSSVQNVQSPQVILISFSQEQKFDQRTLLGLSPSLSCTSMRWEAHGSMGPLWCSLRACGRGKLPRPSPVFKFSFLFGRKPSGEERVFSYTAHTCMDTCAQTQHSQSACEWCGCQFACTLNRSQCFWQ